ncbi:MAG: extracellular solute-binding protein [Clostridia bacterium]|nr:extracellular solute-binding protein [Clostridia bacterium]
MKSFSKIYIALILVFLFAPIAVLILFSFNSGSSTAVFEGFSKDSFQWYKELFTNDAILNALKNSLILAVASAAISTILGTAAAYGIHNMKKKWLRRSVMTTTNIPMINPDIITGISLMFLFVFVGTAIGISNKLSFWTMLIAHVTFCLPYVILNVLPKFRQMDKSLPEAALDLGCTPIQSFFKVQLPAILPGVFTGMIMAFTMSLDDFVISYFTSGVDFQTLPILIYSMTKKSVKPTIYALSTIIFVITLVLLLITNREKSSDDRLEAKKKKEERKLKAAIAKSQKTGKPLKVKKTSEKEIFVSYGRSTNFTKIIALICVLALIISTCVVFSVLSKETIVLNVYNWGEYISDGSEDSYDTNAEFEIYCREELDLNVKVNYLTFSSNEDLYAKLSSGAASYDVIIPSDYMIQRLANEGYLQEINFDNIPNYEKSITEDFRGLYYDPENKYSVPYTYGMIGVIYNASVVPEDEPNIGSWDLMWDPDYKGQILQYNNSRDAFGTAFYKNGWDVNTDDKAVWDNALVELQEQFPILQNYVMDEIYNNMENGEAAIASYYAGDYFTMVDNQAEGVDLQFYYPENTNIFVDAMCIPTCAQNKDLAEKYINFMLSDDAAIANAEYIYYASPHANVYNSEIYKEDIGEDVYATLYPEDFDFHESYNKNGYKDLSPEMKDYINTLWNKLKTESKT